MMSICYSDGGFIENLGTHSLVAGLWSCVYSLGEVLGPAIGGVFVQCWGFPVAVTILAGLNFVTSISGLIYFFRKKLNRTDDIKVIDKTSIFTIERTGDTK